MGEPGANGTNGLDGMAGAAGATGATGATGEPGANGTNGQNGASGPTGPTGNPGTNGQNGATGPTGPQGDAGANGATGATGLQGSPGPVHQEVGAITVQLDLGNLVACTLQNGRPTGATVAVNGTTGCTITFPESDFTDVPILMLTPIDGASGNPTSIDEGQNPDGTWFASYTFAGAPPTVNFIASQVSP
jgi:hypothetical protein